MKKFLESGQVFLKELFTGKREYPVVDLEGVRGELVGLGVLGVEDLREGENGFELAGEVLLDFDVAGMEERYLLALDRESVWGMAVAELVLYLKNRVESGGLRSGEFLPTGETAQFLGSLLREKEWWVESEAFGLLTSARTLTELQYGGNEWVHWLGFFEFRAYEAMARGDWEGAVGELESMALLTEKVALEPNIGAFHNAANGRIRFRDAVLYCAYHASDREAFLGLARRLVSETKGLDPFPVFRTAVRACEDPKLLEEENRFLMGAVPGVEGGFEAIDSKMVAPQMWELVLEMAKQAAGIRNGESWAFYFEPEEWEFRGDPGEKALLEFAAGMLREVIQSSRNDSELLRMTGVALGVLAGDREMTVEDRFSAWGGVYELVWEGDRFGIISAGPVYEDSELDVRLKIWVSGTAVVQEF